MSSGLEQATTHGFEQAEDDAKQLQPNRNRGARGQPQAQLKSEQAEQIDHSAWTLWQRQCSHLPKWRSKNLTMMLKASFDSGKSVLYMKA